MKKVWLLLIIIVVLLIAGYLLSPVIFQQNENQELSMEDLNRVITEEQFIPMFTEAAIDAPHRYDDTTYAFRGSALIDINNDGIEELWLAGGKGEADSLFTYDGERFVNQAAQFGLDINTTTAGGALSIDANNDQRTDLFIAREDGIYFYENTGDTFTEEKLGITIEADAIPMSLSAGDINKDGFVDLYITTFKSPKSLKLATFNSPANRTQNIMAVNNGDGTYSDATESTGLAFDQNTFQATFVDLNNDTWQDLVLATNTDQVIVYENKNGVFEKKEPITELGFWMGLTVADYDNDGDQDIFVSNVGNTIPERNARGDLRNDQVLDLEWRLLENEGNFVFRSVSEETQLLDYEFAWGAVFSDLNLDGKQDLLVSENYVKWPAHRINKLDSRLLIQTDDHIFLPTTEASNAQNPYYGTTPLISDFNQDGYPDLIWVNLGEPTRVLMNNGGDNIGLHIAIPDSLEYLGSRVDIEYNDGTISSHQVIAGQGLLSDSTSSLFIGLGQTKSIDSIVLTTMANETRDLMSLIEDNKIQL